MRISGRFLCDRSKAAKNSFTVDKINSWHSVITVSARAYNILAWTFLWKHLVWLSVKLSKIISGISTQITFKSERVLLARGHDKKAFSAPLLALWLRIYPSHWMRYFGSCDWLSGHRAMPNKYKMEKTNKQTKKWNITKIEWYRVVVNGRIYWYERLFQQR